MAIIINQDKKQISWLFIVGIILAFVFVGLGAYYLFFATPKLLDKVVLPKGLEATKKFRDANVDVSGIVNDPVFKSLRQYVDEPQAGRIGKINPFTPF